jgi:4-aminobutyrate aminotransferase/4-aminobutyrate aminotransferase/(S)-3-amino-2-methylpropionate transaminase
VCNFYADRAENSEIWDVEGKRYIDFAAGIAVLNTAIATRGWWPRAAQLNRFTHTAYQIVPYASYVAGREDQPARAGPLGSQDRLLHDRRGSRRERRQDRAPPPAGPA